MVDDMRVIISMVMKLVAAVTTWSYWPHPIQVHSFHTIDFTSLRALDSFLLILFKELLDVI